MHFPLPQLHLLKMPTLDDLPQELLNTILGHLESDRQAFGNVRLVWPSLEAIILPRLFSVIRLSFLEKHRLQFLGISSSPHLAPHVRILRWHSLCHTEDYPDSISLDQLEAFLSSDAIHNFRPLFLEGLDAMVNLRTITTIMLHPSQSRGALWHEDVALRSIPDYPFSKLDLLQGFDNFLVPAMLRYGSKVESLRMLCKSVMLDDQDQVSEQGSAKAIRPGEGMCIFGDPPSYDRALIEAFRSLSVRLDSMALRNVKELDLCATFPSATSWGFQRRELQSMLVDRVAVAKELRVLSLRSTDPESELEPNSRHSTTFPGLYQLQFQHLTTLKFVNLVFSTNEFNLMLATHSETLKHILLYNCAGSDNGLIEVVRFAAEDPLVRLHRFAVCIPETVGLGPWKKDEPAAAQIIHEQEIVDFINSNEAKNQLLPVSRRAMGPPAKDPFLLRQPIGSDDWHSVHKRTILPNMSIVDHYANIWATAVENSESLTSEWPQWGNLHYACKACRRLSGYE